MSGGRRVLVRVPLLLVLGWDGDGGGSLPLVGEGRSLGVALRGGSSLSLAPLLNMNVAA